MGEFELWNPGDLTRRYIDGERASFTALIVGVREV